MINNVQCNDWCYAVDMQNADILKFKKFKSVLRFELVIWSDEINYKF